MIQVKNRIEKVAYREILYILKNGKYAVFHLKNGEMKSIRKTLAQVFEELNKEYFYFADRGCIVNLANVVGLNENGVIFGLMSISKLAKQIYRNSNQLCFVFGGNKYDRCTYNCRVVSCIYRKYFVFQDSQRNL